VPGTCQQSPSARCECSTDRRRAKTRRPRLIRSYNGGGITRQYGVPPRNSVCPAQSSATKLTCRPQQSQPRLFYGEKEDAPTTRREQRRCHPVSSGFVRQRKLVVKLSTMTTQNTDRSTPTKSRRLRRHVRADRLRTPERERQRWPACTERATCVGRCDCRRRSTRRETTGAPRLLGRPQRRSRPRRSRHRSHRTVR
jgi:hypothetical protein